MNVLEAVGRINPDNIEVPNPTTREFLVSTYALNVRTQPSTDPRTLLPNEQLHQGEQVEVFDTSRTETEGFVWWEHQAGWSAERTRSNSEVYMVDVDDPIPPPDFLFERLPVDLNDLQWLYYYGNTVFAFLYGIQNNYDGYSQGLHGGLDFGHEGRYSDLCRGAWYI